MVALDKKDKSIPRPNVSATYFVIDKAQLLQFVALVHMESYGYGVDHSQCFVTKEAGIKATLFPVTAPG